MRRFIRNLSYIPRPSLSDDGYEIAALGTEEVVISDGDAEGRPS